MTNAANLFGDGMFGDDLLPADTVARVTEAYAAKLLLNPPTPSFNVNTNDKAEAFARRVAPKDITRLLSVLADLGLEIVPKKPAGPGHGDGAAGWADHRAPAHPAADYGVVPNRKDAGAPARLRNAET